MMTYERSVDDISPSPGSPPPMTDSKSSKTSSFLSSHSGDDGALDDVSHFEEIGLEDDTQHDPRHLADQYFKAQPNPYSATFSADVRTATLRQASASTPRLQYSKNMTKTAPRRELVAPPSRPPFPTSQPPMGLRNGRVSSGLSPNPRPSLLNRTQSPGSQNQGSLTRQRSHSPNLSLNPRDPNLKMQPRRRSWQTNRERKSALELELECDEDDGDDIPDDLVLDNVPISPRPPIERAKSQPCSKAASPERSAKDRVRSVGNGTPPVAAAHGSFKSPTWKSETSVHTLATTAKPPTSPSKGRAKSWTDALAELNSEAQQLTEKLEEHAGEIEHKSQRSSTGSIPKRRSADHYEPKPRVKSALAELPPLRRTNIMIDPLPISKEKEAVLSRTRPSWLPPKDPAEEKRHLKEYQKMMAQSAEAEKRRAADKRIRSECRDTAADSMMHLWEADILPRWNDAIRERRTRELWWRGIAPRSRGAVWSRAIGNSLGLTDASYKAALSRAREAEDRVKSGTGTVEDNRYITWREAILKDVEQRTWRELRIFQAGGPLHASLVNVLSAYVMYRSDIGYVPGCNTIAALLLLNLPNPTAAFIALANVLNRPLPLSFHAFDAGARASAYNLLLQTLLVKSPTLHDHLVHLPDHDPEVYLASIFTSLFTSHLALDEAARLWDVYVFESDTVMVRACVAYLCRKEMALLGAKSMSEVQKIFDTGSSNASDEDDQRVVTKVGEEDRWMVAVREAGKV